MIGQSEYLAANPEGVWALKAHADFLKLEAANGKAIQAIYDDAAARLADRISKLNVGSMDATAAKQMKRSIALASQDIGKGLRAQLIKDTAKAAEAGGAGVQIPLFEKLTGMDGGGKFTRIGLTNAMATVNRLAVIAQWTRNAGGLMLSDRIWATAASFRKDLLRLVDFASASGIGSRDLARMVETLAKEGGYQLEAKVVADFPNAAKRLGKHFPKNLNWQALRLARTELGFAYNTSAVMAGRITPGYIGSQWLLSNAHPEMDICDDLASADPYGLGPGCYTRGNEPVFAHPNCLCCLTPIFMEREEFNSRMSGWIRGKGWSEMDKWYKDVYRP